VKIFLALFLCLPMAAQVAVSPIVQPHVNLVDASGNPCAGCTFQSYAAGTTTPLATYTDSSGTSTNTNPIVLDAAGGANVWLSNSSYKFILKTGAGATIWTVDNVKGGGGLGGICGPSGAIQIANGGVNGLTCDPTILINTTNHTINVGTLPASHVTIGAVGTPTTWTFDTTTPATALASLGGGSVGAGTTGQMPYYAGAGSALTATSAIPSTMTATTQAASDNSTKLATTAYVALPGSVAPSSLIVAAGSAMTGNQGTGALVQHSTGTIATGNCFKADATGNAIDSGLPCAAAITGTLVIASPLSLASNTCSAQAATMSASVPAGRVVTISPAQGTTVTGLNQPPTIVSVSGATVTVDFCNAWIGTVVVGTGTYNLGVN
jgi:hypothetical protein